MAKPLFEIPGFVSGRVVGLLLVLGIFALTIYQMRRKKLPYIRRVPAIDAVEEAIGRSTEMGKPVAISFGLGGFGYTTIAALSILGYAARVCADTDTRLIVPTGGGSSSYMTRELAVDIVRNQYQMAGKPEKFREDDMPFLSGQQYSYTAGYIGLLIRERPGAVVMAGAHASEVMNIAEVSNSVGALTITAASSSSYMACLACASDYIMLMDEQPAAGAYLSKNPELLATIRVADIYKVLAVVLLIVGLIAINVFASDFFDRLFIS